MKTAIHDKSEPEMKQEALLAPDMIKAAFGKVAPFWPLKNLIAVNPLQGLEDMPIEEALKLAGAYFQQPDLPQEMESVNRETIKWLQVFFDDGQATISMPLRKHGLYAAWRKLAVYDKNLHGHDAGRQQWLRGLPESPQQAIAECLLRLSIAKNERETFLTLMLTTLPGWAAHVKYRTEWAGPDATHPHRITQPDYLAMRLAITTLLWPKAKSLLAWHAQAMKRGRTSPIDALREAETAYRLPLLKTLAQQTPRPPHTPEAQWVFCIDVRSEPFRRNLEAMGDYQTLGFAGFFGIPVQITDGVTGDSHASCPVLLTPTHTVKESPCGHQPCSHDRMGYERIMRIKRLYQSVKYTFTAPFALVEGIGIASGAWMALRSISPGLAYRLKSSATNRLRPPQPVAPSLDGIRLAEQSAYAGNALRMMGLTSHFAPVVVFCGHGSATQNNAYATALDCGACGGRHGASNARILAAILNNPEVRATLAQTGIAIPQATRFIAAEHNTTTDEVTLYGAVPDKLKADLEKARQANSRQRLKHIQRPNGNTHDSRLRAQDWAQVRPEWGLARNAAFIAAPRDLTAALDLQGRCFLHSYDYQQDPQGSSLAVILTAPLVVAEWINMQYLFSTLDNAAYGGGSKITQNITGKIGIMQGNASDLMTGLPLQSVYSSDTRPYHEPQRLMGVVYAPRRMISTIVQAQPVLQKLFGNGWVQLACIDPHTHHAYFLGRDLAWQSTH